MPHGPTTGSAASPAGLSVLLVDDDVELCELMQEFFARRGIRLDTINDSRRGLSRALAACTRRLGADALGRRGSGE